MPRVIHFEIHADIVAKITAAGGTIALPKMAIPGVAVYTDPDRGAPHLDLADEAVALGSADRYLSIEALRQAVADDKHQYCYACYTRDYPTELVQIEELVAAKGRRR